jgi:hypothetical protein
MVGDRHMYMYGICHDILLQGDVMIVAAADRLRIVILGKVTLKGIRELDPITALYSQVLAYAR